MVHAAFGQADHSSPPRLQAPAEVHLFHVGKEAGVQTAGCVPVRAAHHERGARGPEHRGRPVILPPVALHRVHHPAATVGVAKAVEVAPGSAGILKRVALRLAEQLGLAGRYFGVGVHVAQQGWQPPLGHLHVGIEQEEVVRRELGERPVIAFGETIIAVEPQRADLRKLAGQHVERAVGRGVVSHDDVGLVAAVPHHRRQETLHHLPPVPVQDNYGYSFHFVSFYRQSRPRAIRRQA